MGTRSGTTGVLATGPVVLSLVALSLAGVARSGATPSGVARPMRFTRLPVDQALSQNTVTCILQDRTGFLWIGTQDGLNRYDGYGFRVYRHDPRDPASLPHNWILALAEDRSGDLWIGTEGGGLGKWRRATDRFVAYRPLPDDPRSLSGDRVPVISLDRSGALWLGTFEAGLNRLDPATGEFVRFRHDPADPSSLADDRIRSIYEDRTGNLWIGTMGGLHRFDESRSSFHRYRHDPGDPGSLPDDRVRALLEDGDGRLWVGTFAGLGRIHPPSGSFDRYLADASRPGSLSHSKVRALFEDDAGRLWIGTDGGLNLWQPEHGTFASYRHDPADPRSISSDQVVDIYQDRGGILWLATIGGGLNQWNPQTRSFPHYRSSDFGSGTHSDNIFAIAEDAAGRLWLGTFGGGLQRIDRATEARTSFRHDPQDLRSLGDDRITALLHDRSGVLWIGTVSGGLNRLDPQADGFERFLHRPSASGSLSADSVASLFQDRRDRLWIGTYGGGLNLWRGDGTFTHLRHDPGDLRSLSNDRVVAFAEDAAGRLWIATDGGGLNCLDPDMDSFLRIQHDPAREHSLSSNELISLHVDRNGRIWIGTKGNGLDRLTKLDPDAGTAEVENYSTLHGLPGDIIWGIESDLQGNLWISTSQGLARLDPRTRALETYDTSHGLQALEFNMGAHYRGPSGELFFGGINGFNAFFPDRVDNPRAAPPVVLTGLTRFNEPLPISRPVFDLDEIVLDYSDHFLTFEFAALDYWVPENNQYRYRLTGLDDAWVELGNERRVTFPSLEPGRHVLQVQGSNSDGVWNEEGTSVAITVAPAPWQTWWAQTLYAVTAAAAVWLFVVFQNRRIERERKRVRERERNLFERERLIIELERKNAELEHFNYTVSHDLKTPLVTIKGFLGYLRNDLAGGSSERVDRDLKHISDAADRMSSLLDDLLAFALVGRHINPPESVALHELAYEARELLAGILGEHRVDLEIARDLPEVWGDRVRLRAVFQNLIENAVKYMGDQTSPRIEIDCRRGDDGEVVLVRDNGRGIEPRYHAKIFELFERLDADNRGTGIGLALVKRIVDLHGGRVWVESDGPGHGSTFCFTIGKLRAERVAEPATAAFEDPAIWY